MKCRHYYGYEWCRRRGGTVRDLVDRKDRFLELDHMRDDNRFYPGGYTKFTFCPLCGERLIEDGIQKGQES